MPDFHGQRASFADDFRPAQPELAGSKWHHNWHQTSVNLGALLFGRWYGKHQCEEEASMDDTIRDGARLSIADAIEADLEDKLAAIGIHMIFTPIRGGGVRQPFRCPNRECHQPCGLLHFAGGASYGGRALRR